MDQITHNGNRLSTGENTNDECVFESLMRDVRRQLISTNPERQWSRGLI